MSDEVSDLKTDLNYVSDETKSQFPDINGVILPPRFAVGSRYVQNGADKWVNYSNRISFAKGTFINLKIGDVVTKTSDVYTFSGGYSTDNGATFTSISNRSDPYVAPADGLYFFNLSKPNSGTYTEADALNGWKYITFFRSGSLKDQVTELFGLGADVENIENAIEYAVSPVVPTEYYEMIPDTGLNYLGRAVTDANQESSDYISLENLYDVCRVVTNKTVYSLGSICYYTETKSFIRRDLPGTSYEFAIYNGETVVWLNIDKTVANAKYVRFCADDTYNFKYWVVENAPQATILEKYSLMPFYGKKIVNFGDSIFGITRPPKDVSSYLAEDTGATVYNCGFGGCEMSEHANSNYNPFSMYSLAEAVATGTWTAQETAAALSGMPTYFPETVALLKSIDFSKIDIVTISYGTNDWNNSSPLDNGGNSNMAYYADALRFSIETLLTAYPNLRIFICTPIYRFWMDNDGNFTEDSNTKINTTTNTKLTDFIDKTIEVAKQYGLHYINDYEIGMNKWNRSYYFPANDGTHPNPKGNKLIADNIANKIY